MKEKRKITKNEKGITLIALVVTIVVLLILAGVTITMVLGEGGILDMAKQAADKTNQATANEQGDVANLVGEISDILEGKDPVKLQDAVESQKVFSYTTGYDKDGNKIDGSSEEGKTPAITIPAGFKIVEGDLTKINEGIVISDKDGNEFVWVPCTEAEYVKHTYNNSNTNDTEKNIQDTAGGWDTTYYRAYSDWKEDDEAKNKESVKKYGGFYIARYEAGVPSNAPFYVSKDEVDTKEYATDKGIYNGLDVSNLKPVSKKEMQAWNFITQENAKTVSENMYKGSGSVNSKLVDGIAWDRTVAWISTNSKFSSVAINSTNYGNYANNGEDIGDKNGSTKKIKYKGFEVSNTLWAEHLYKAEDSTIIDWCIGTKYRYGKFTSGYADPWEGSTDGYTNYDEDSKYHYRHYVEMATGASENTKMNNIYDMAGNMYEWTTEYGFHEQVGGTKYALLRGGGFMDKSAPVSFRKGDGLASMMASVDRGFRVVLYVK